MNFQFDSLEDMVLEKTDLSLELFLLHYVLVLILLYLSPAQI